VLVISRFPNQKVYLFEGGQLLGTLCVVEIRGLQVRLGFDMDPYVQITREELLAAPVQAPVMPMADGGDAATPPNQGASDG